MLQLQRHGHAASQGDHSYGCQAVLEMLAGDDEMVAVVVKVVVVVVVKVVVVVVVVAVAFMIWYGS